MIARPLCIVLAVLAVAAVGSSGAGAQHEETPEAAALAFFEAMRDGDWEGAAMLMHPQALEEFKEMLSQLAATASEDELVQIFGVETLEEYEALEPADVFVSLIEFAAESRPESAEIFASLEAEMIGHVMEDETAHVVCRLSFTFGDATVSKVTVVSLRRDGGVWRTLLSGELQGILPGVPRSGTQ